MEKTHLGAVCLHRRLDRGPQRREALHPCTMLVLGVLVPCLCGVGYSGRKQFESSCFIMADDPQRPHLLPALALPSPPPPLSFQNQRLTSSANTSTIATIHTGTSQATTPIPCVWVFFPPLLPTQNGRRSYKKPWTTAMFCACLHPSVPSTTASHTNPHKAHHLLRHHDNHHLLGIVNVPRTKSRAT
jgi:hypothetical protein